METQPTTFEEQTQMINYLQKRVSDHIQEKNNLIEMNEELETDLI